MLVLLDPLLAPIELESAVVELTVATVEPLVESFRARAVMPFDATVAPLDLAIPVLDVTLAVLQPTLDSIVIAAGFGRRC